MWNRQVLLVLLVIVDRLQPSSQSDVGRDERNTEGTPKNSGRDAITTEDAGLRKDPESRRTKKSDDRIVGGEVIEITESPSTVLIFIELGPAGSNLCAGSLLSNRFLLTAAHCVTQDLKRNPASYRVVNPEALVMHTGTSYLDRGGDLNYAQAISVHPEFLHYYPVELYRDIAVVKLKYEVQMGKRSQVAALYRPRMTDENMAGNRCKVAGWGRIYENGDVSKQLRQVTVTLKSREFCERQLTNDIDIEAHVCAKDEGKDACAGDSGGGLFCDGKLLAVTSWGYGCASISPAVYARADTALDFIDKIMNGEKSMTLPLWSPCLVLPLLVSAVALA